MKGTITRLIAEKFYGFIKDEDGNDRFFHARHLDGAKFEDLKEGTRVEFQPYEGQISFVDVKGADGQTYRRAIGVGKDNNLRAKKVSVVAEAA